MVMLCNYEKWMYWNYFCDGKGLVSYGFVWVMGNW